MDMIRRFFAHTLNLGGSTDEKADLKVEKVRNGFKYYN